MSQLSQKMSNNKSSGLQGANSRMIETTWNILKPKLNIMDSHGDIYIYMYTYVRIYPLLILIVSILQQTWVKKSKQAAFPLPVAPYARMHTALQSASLGCQWLLQPSSTRKWTVTNNVTNVPKTISQSDSRCKLKPWAFTPSVLLWGNSIFWKAVQVTPRRTSLALQRSLKFILNLTEDLQRRSLDEHAYKM